MHQKIRGKSLVLELAVSWSDRANERSHMTVREYLRNPRMGTEMGKAVVSFSTKQSQSILHYRDYRKNIIEEELPNPQPCNSYIQQFSRAISCLNFIVGLPQHYHSTSLFFMPIDIVLSLIFIKQFYFSLWLQSFLFHV